MQRILLVALTAALVLFGRVLAAIAAENPASLQTSVSSATTERKKLSLAGTFGKSVSLVNRQDGADSSSLDFGLGASYLVSDDLLASFLIERSVDEKTEEAEWTRAQFGLASENRVLAQGWIDAVPSVSLGLPIAKKDFTSSLRARVSVSSQFSLRPEKTGITDFTFSYTPTLAYAFFEYETAEFSGKPNSPLATAHSFEVSYAVSATVIARANVTYRLQQNTARNWYEFWSHGEELSWQPAKSWALALGHQFGAPYAPIRKANGEDMNLALISDTDSLIYTQVTVMF